MPDTLLSPSGQSYSEYRQDHKYKSVSGVRIAASSNRNGAARLIRVAGEYGTRTVDTTSTRAGAPPLVPKAEDLPNDTLVSHTIHVPLPVFDQNQGRYIFRADTSYEYLQTDLRVPGDDVFPTGKYPYPLEPLDTIQRLALNDIPTLPIILAGANVVVELATALAGTVDMNRLYTWSITSLPAETFTTLIS